MNYPKNIDLNISDNHTFSAIEKQENFIEETINFLSFNFFTGISKLFKKQDSPQETLDNIVSDDHPLRQDEHIMLMNILGLKDLKVSDIMVPRADIVAIDHEFSLEMILELFKTSQHSRLPIYKESLDNPMGFIHIKDALTLHLDTLSLNNKAINIKDIIRNILYVPASVTVRDLLGQMQSSNTHMALVVDEYGGTDGVVTIENLVERIIGKINDDTTENPENSLFTEKENGIYEVDARLEMSEIDGKLSLDMDDTLNDADIDTIGGFVTAFIGRVPQRGEIIPYYDRYEFHILDATPKRIKNMNIVKIQ